MAYPIALTGGIGSGKSTVAAMFANMGVAVLDLDAVGRNILNTKHIQDALVDTFGADIQKKNKIDRRLLAERAFCDKQNTARLNAILHPEILHDEQQWLAQQQGVYAIIEASVLLESGGAERMHGVIVVLADQELRKKRVLARGKQDEAMFEKIIARQCDDHMRRAHANYVLNNDGSLQALQQQLIALAEQLKRELS